MSLQLAAQHMASRGRGPDTQLVHMAPQEVAGLHALAKAHGGSLTINPDTGLPEAGFLSKILPMVLGAGAMMIPGLQGLGAGWIGAGIGGLTTLATGSLSKGLMAGLGAFGGAGLASGLMGAGTGALSSAAGTAGANSVGALAENALTPVLDPLTSGIAETAATEGAGVMGTNIPTMGRSAAEVANIGDAQRFLPADYTQGAPFAQHSAAAMPTTITPMAAPAPYSTAISQEAIDIGNVYAQEQAAQNAVAKQLATTTPMGTAKAGLDAIYEKPDLFFNKGNLKYAGSALTPMLMQDPQKLPEKDKLKPFEYSYDPGRAADPQAGYSGAYTGERTYFNPIYTRTAAGGGLMDIGPVESMSRSNQSQMAPAYAQGGVSDMAVNPYTGAEMFAEGGKTKAVRPVEEDPYYAMSGESGDAFKYLMGLGPKPAAAVTPQPATQPLLPPPTTMPIDRTSGGVMGALRGLIKEPTSDATLRPYTFDPSTGAYTALPIIRPVDYETAPTVAPTMDYGSFGSGTYADGGIASLAQGGPSHLGDYSDGGRLLKGPGDGVSDSIPATIADKRPARLADGEFVVPARIVSELGNGSTEAGARKLYAMMDRVQKARKKSIGKNRVAVNSRTENMLPA